MKKNKFILLLFIYVLILTGCTSTKNRLVPTNNKGGYETTVLKNRANAIDGDVIKVKGRVLDIKSGKPISTTILVFGCRTMLVSAKGEYSFEIEASKYDPFYLQASDVMYRFVETERIDLTNVSEIKIDFYLAIDTRPLLECAPPAHIQRMQEEMNNLK